MKITLKTSKNIVVMVCLLLIVRQAEALSSGETASTILKIGPGVRATAMGGAFVGVADDVTALHWNPAGLMRLKKSEISFMHAAWFQNLSYEYAALGLFGDLPLLGETGVGVSLVMLDNGTFDETRYENGQFIDTDATFKASDMLFTFGLAKQFVENWKAGFAVKLISQNIAGNSAMAFALDLGALYDTEITGLTVGGVLQNLGTKLQLDQTGYVLPVAFKLGGAWNVPESGFLVSADIVQPVENTTLLYAGSEFTTKYNFMQLMVRFGYRYALKGKDLNTGMTAGGGATVLGLQIDYTFEPYGQLGNTNRFGLTYKW